MRRVRLRDKKFPYSKAQARRNLLRRLNRLTPKDPSYHLVPADDVFSRCLLRWTSHHDRSERRRAREDLWEVIEFEVDEQIGLYAAFMNGAGLKELHEFYGRGTEEVAEIVECLKFYADAYRAPLRALLPGEQGPPLRPQRRRPDPPERLGA